MSLSFPDHKAEREKLFAEYLGLPKPAQELMQIVSFIEWIPSVHDLLTLLQESGLEDDDGLIGRERWKSLIRECKARGVLVERYGEISCAAEIRELCSRHCFRSGNFDRFTALIEDHRKRTTTHRYENPLEKIRRAVVSGKAGSIFNSSSPSVRADATGMDWSVVFNRPFDENDVAGIGPEHLRSIMRDVMRDTHRRLEPADAAGAFLRKKIDAGEDPSGRLEYLLGSHLLITGRFAEYDGLRAAGKPPVLLFAMECALKGEDEKAVAAYEDALKAMRKTSGRRNAAFEDLSDFLFILSLVRAGTEERLRRARTHLSQTFKHDAYPAGDWRLRFDALSYLFDDQGLFLGPPQHRKNIVESHLPSDPIRLWCVILMGRWLNAEVPAKPLKLLAEAHDIVKARGYLWFASETAELLHRLTGEDSWREEAAALRGGWTRASLADAVKKTEPWQRTLEALKTLASPAAGSGAEQRLRFVWEVSLPQDLRYSNGVRVEARERKLLKSGQWSAGKLLEPSALARGYVHDDLLTSQDRLVIKSLARGTSWDYDIAVEALAELAGHPAVYWRFAPQRRVEIVLGEPLLTVAFRKGAYRLAMEPPIGGDETRKFIVRKESDDRIVVYPVRPHHAQAARILGGGEVVVPASARETLLAAIGAVSPRIGVRADIEGGPGASERVEADGRPTVRIRDRAGGMTLELGVRPVPNGRVHPTGRGPAAVYETIDGKTFFARRDFREEKRLLEKLIDQCPVLASHVDDPADPVPIDDPLDCLEVLDELRRAEPDAIVLWREKKPVTITAAQTPNMSFRVRPVEDWFGIEGELRVDDGRVVSFRELLDLLDTARGRFVRLDENTFLALTQEFRRRLERIRALSSRAGGETRLHPLAALALPDLPDVLPGLAVCDEWKANAERVRAVLAEVPPAPSSFEGELRDYQKDGFTWLARLAALGAGACLADDMGLGKTVQAIALLLHRARGGPALVVAPTSVCLNWIDELRRFAPTLAPALFSESEREACAAEAGPGDVVVCSYGLVNRESELLSRRTWHTIILDEAQAIKNTATQRSKAVMELRGDFRLVTTGTPVENHLGELWNVFRFINPGLLGTLDEFNRRFAAAIEGRNDQETKHRLKSIIAPFILRRLKSQVLEELPPKTEIVMYVDVSDEERALYEALRQNALETLSGGGDEPGRHLKILAQIMKLRRACCHPSLALPGTALPGSKLETFGLCVDELVDNGHRALVFSQFVDHLSIVKEWCDRRNMTYQYLDGGTPARERSERIDAFQRGEGTLFLMSLKAGGVGVNLTAADYVILLDPWWNPAVEDQASARAHRIGQTRPVTIYRLIARNTIEEKILDLHKRKRDLAESLLEGDDMSGRISAEELISLIRDTM